MDKCTEKWIKNLQWIGTISNCTSDERREHLTKEKVKSKCQKLVLSFFIFTVICSLPLYMFFKDMFKLQNNEDKFNLYIGIYVLLFGILGIGYLGITGYCFARCSIRKLYQLFILWTFIIHCILFGGTGVILILLSAKQIRK